MLTIETINSTNDLVKLYQIEQRLSYDISMLSKPNIKDEIKENLIKEANDYGISSLNEYIKLKINQYLTLKQACINRYIDIKSNTHEEHHS